jgi:SAM-dependent methyltransferase
MRENIRATTRVDRERAVWEDAYTPGTSAHDQYLWNKHIEGLSHIEQQFYLLLNRFSRMRILSIGGGVDRAASYLAKRGNRVISADLSYTAANATQNLQKQPASRYLHAVIADCQRQSFREQSFDVIVSKRALHHMDIPQVADIVYELLVPGGLFVAEEPVCLSTSLRLFHKKVPFHPTAVRTEDERELREEDLQIIGTRFQNINIQYFDLLARESVAYCLYRLRVEGMMLRPLGRFDDFVANRCFRWVRRFCSYVIIECRK